MKIGILGSGQLGRMLALAGYPLGHTFTFFDTAPNSATSNLGVTTLATFDDHTALGAFSAACDVVTYEFENVPYQAALTINAQVPVYPPARALKVSQDRVIEKEFLQGLGIATPAFLAVSSEAELHAACLTLGTPCIVKTRRLGYDGKGQVRINSKGDIAGAWRELSGAPLIVEGFIPFTRELSVIAVRSIDGTVLTYPLVQNVHRSGILHRSETPAPEVTQKLEAAAYQIAATVLQELQYVGVIAIELFDVDGELLVNELAPRVHNSGHATIDGVITSQFENHIRAITGTALGSVEPRSRSVMYNLVGTLPDLSRLTALSNAKLHLYGKEPRAGRKLGHVTLLNPSQRDEQTLEQLLGGVSVAVVNPTS